MIPVVDLTELIAGPKAQTSADVVHVVVRSMCALLGGDLSVTALPYMGAGLLLVRMSARGLSDTRAVELGEEPAAYAAMAVEVATAFEFGWRRVFS
jgi:hypothetical protein